METLKIFVSEIIFVGLPKIISRALSVIKETVYKLVLLVRKVWSQVQARAPGVIVRSLNSLKNTGS